MARSGVTEEQVAQAADALILAGERPTIERVRATLGTGSPNTLIRHLDAWWKGLGERLTETRRQVDLPDAPKEVSEAASAIWRLALARAADIACKEFEQQRVDLEKERLALEEARVEAEREVTKAKTDAAEARLAAEKLALRAEGLEQLREQHLARIETLEDELMRTRKHTEVLAAEQKAAAGQIQDLIRTAKDERESAAEHVKSIEDRAHQEVDRARLEASKAAKRIADLEKQLQRQSTESARRAESLARDLRKAETECAALRVRVATGNPTKAKKTAARKHSASRRTTRPKAPG